jgi:hypothetical protein
MLAIGAVIKPLGGPTQEVSRRIRHKPLSFTTRLNGFSPPALTPRANQVYNILMIANRCGRLAYLLERETNRDRANQNHCHSSVS